MDEPTKKKTETALRLWEIEFKTLENNQQLPNKGNYLIWRKNLLLKKATLGKLQPDGKSGRLGDYLAFRVKQLSKKQLTTSMKKSRSADSVEDMGSFVRSHQRRTSAESRRFLALASPESLTPPPVLHDGEISPRGRGKTRGGRARAKARRSLVLSGDHYDSSSDSSPEILPARKRATSDGKKHSDELNLDSPSLDTKGVRVRTNIVLQRSKVSATYEFAGMHHIFMEHSKAVTCIKFANKETNLLAFCSDDGNISICQGLIHPKLLRTLQGHTDAITDFCWSQTNEIIVSTSDDRTARVWSTKSGECIKLVKDGSPLTCCRFHPANPKIGTGKGLVKKINVADGSVTEKIKLGNPIQSMEFSVSGNSLFVGDIKGVVYTIQFDSQGHMKWVAKATVSAKQVNMISFKPVSVKGVVTPYLLFSCPDNSIKLYKVESKIVSGNHLTLVRTMSIPNNKELIRSAFCPFLGGEGVCIVSGSEDMSVYIYDVLRPDGRPVCINQLQGHSSIVQDVSWNADETLLASCDATGMVILWKRTKSVITESADQLTN